MFLNKEEYSHFLERYLIDEKYDDNFPDGFFLYADRQGGIFENDQTYPDITTMAGEFKKKFGVYLTKDFDYEAHLAFFSGAQCC